jgi:hypothetical protein
MKYVFAIVFLLPIASMVGCGGGGGDNVKPTNNEVQDYLKENPDLLKPSENADTFKPLE